MHVALVTTFPPSRGTLCEYAQHFALALVAKPGVTKLTVIADHTTDPETIRHEKLEVRRVWRFNDPASALRINAALRDVQPDAVLYNLQFASFGDRKVSAALGLFAPMLSRLAGFPTITLMHNLMDTVDLSRAGFGASRLMETAARIAGRVVTRALLTSHRVAVTMPSYVDILRTRYRAQNVFLAPHGAFSRREPAPLPEQRTVMTFGKFGTYKRVEVLIEAHKRLLARDANVRLVIAGSDSPNAAGYLEQVKQRYADVPNLHFTGYVPEENVPHLFEDSSVVAFPYSATTGSSGVLHQAGEYARAAVMPAIGDLEELTRTEGYAAAFFAPEDPDSLADALWSVIADPDEARSMGLVNHRAASGLLIEEVADDYLAAFEAIRHRTPRATESRHA
jgi:glycosyltransferase involved in cell wall biosynthesis